MKHSATFRELSAEFLGTFVLMIFGLGVNAQVTLGDGDYGDWFSVNVGWGLAVVMGVYVAGGVTGAHINPAVTLALAATKRFQWNKVVPFVLAQLVGAFVASALIYIVYLHAIDSLEIITKGAGEAFHKAPRTMATAGIWATYPREFADGSILPTFPDGLVDQIVGTALLVLCIFAIADTRNLAPESNMGPLLVGCVVFLVGMTFGSNCGYAINPARDFAPRMFTYVAGWGSQVFTANDYFFWVPIVGPCIGGVLGGFTYDILIGQRHPAAEAS